MGRSFRDGLLRLPVAAPTRNEESHRRSGCWRAPDGCRSAPSNRVAAVRPAMSILGGSSATTNDLSCKPERPVPAKELRIRGHQKQAGRGTRVLRPGCTQEIALRQHPSRLPQWLAQVCRLLRRGRQETDGRDAGRRGRLHRQDGVPTPLAQGDDTQPRAAVRGHDPGLPRRDQAQVPRAEPALPRRRPESGRCPARTRAPVGPTGAPGQGAAGG